MGQFHGCFAPCPRPLGPWQRSDSAGQELGRNGELLVCRVLRSHHSAQMGQFHGCFAPFPRPQGACQRFDSAGQELGRNGELLVCRVLHSHHSAQIGADSTVVLRLARVHNVPVDVSVARGLLLDETVSF